MPIGPGKYDDLCTVVRERSSAMMALVIILGGKRGSGFSVQAADYVQMMEHLSKVPAMLRTVADQIEADMAAKGSA